MLHVEIEICRKLMYTDDFFLLILLFIRDTHGISTTVSSILNRKPFLKLKAEKKILTQKAEIQRKIQKG